MNIYIRSMALCFCLALWSITVHAAVWQEAMQVEMNLGERDTRVAIRAAALEEMRGRASQKVGMIVESTMVSSGATLTEEIKTVGVSLVKIDNVREEVRLQKDGSLRLLVSGTVTVDTSELDRRAQTMREDSEKAFKIKQLASENQVLRRSLSDIAKLLGQQGTATSTAELLRQQALILDSLGSNAQRVGQTFEQGALLGLAQKDEAGWLAVKGDIEAGLFERIFNAKVTAKIVRVENNAENVGVVIQMGWDSDQVGIAKVLGRYMFGMNSYREEELRSKELTFLKYDNGVRADWPYAERVYRYLSMTTVDLEVAISGAKKLIPVMFAADNWSRPCQHPTERYSPSCDRVRLQISRLSPQSTKIPGIRDNNDANPIRLNLSKVQARDASEVVTTWVLTREDGTVVRRKAAMQ